jgi:hypothetical protein
MALTNKSNEHSFFQQVAEKETRKLKAQQKKNDRLVYFGSRVTGYSIRDLARQNLSAIIFLDINLFNIRVNYRVYNRMELDKYRRIK